MITVYGIRQCDICRKTLNWLAAAGFEHRFHDFRADGLSRDLLEGWMHSPFAGQLVNRRSTTWRGLSEKQKALTGRGLLQLLMEHPTLIKRPVLDNGEILAVGFNSGELASLLGIPA